MKLIFIRCFWTPIKKYDTNNGHVFKVFLDTIYYFSDVLQIMWCLIAMLAMNTLHFDFMGAHIWFTSVI